LGTRNLTDITTQDGPFLDLNWAQWNGTLGPKVRGTWNLHEALADQPLDFFWMASSLVTIIDEPGQGNYSAGCAFLEAFCQYRHSLGLPASVLNICPVDGVGYVAENPHARRNMKAQGIYSLGEHEFLDFVRFNLLQARTGVPAAQDGDVEPATFTTPWESHSQIVMGLRSDSDIHLDDPNNRTSWRRDRRMGRYHNAQAEATDAGTASGASPLSLFLDRVLGAELEQDGLLALLTEPENAAFLARQLGQRIYELILKPVDNVDEIDTRLTLAQIGLDSLMAIELRRWLRRVVGVAVSVLEIMGAGSLIQLSGVVANKLAEKAAK
jgi:aryl carrier-like protein